MIEPLFLYNGVTTAFFSSFGIVPDEINSLNNFLIVDTNSNDNAFNIFVEIPVAQETLGLNRF